MTARDRYRRFGFRLRLPAEQTDGAAKGVLPRRDAPHKGAYDFADKLTILGPILPLCLIHLQWASASYGMSCPF